MIGMHFIPSTELYYRSSLSLPVVYIRQLRRKCNCCHRQRYFGRTLSRSNLGKKRLAQSGEVWQDYQASHADLENSFTWGRCPRFPIEWPGEKQNLQYSASTFPFPLR